MPDEPAPTNAPPPGGPDPNNDPPKPNSTDLGDAGKKALDEERTARREADRQLKAAKAELETLKAQSMSDAEKAVAKAKEEGKSEVLAVANARLVKAEVRAAAAGKVDPALAVRLLDLADFKVDDDGEVDAKAIGRAIDQLLKDHPNLATNGNGRPAGSADGGPRGGAGPQDMNAIIRDRMGRR